MKLKTPTRSVEAEIWARVIHPEGEISLDVAKAILKLKFPASDLTRIKELSRLAQEGRLSTEDDAEMDRYERVGAMLTILKAKSRQVVRDHGKS